MGEVKGRDMELGRYQIKLEACGASGKVDTLELAIDFWLQTR